VKLNPKSAGTVSGTAFGDAQPDTAAINANMSNARVIRWEV
jgi:hypothetical protein